MTKKENKCFKTPQKMERRRWFSGQMHLLHEHRDQNSSPQHPHKIGSMLKHACSLNTGRPKQILKAHCPESPVKPENFKFTERAHLMGKD